MYIQLPGNQSYHSNRMQDLICSLGLFIMYLTVVSDDLHLEIA